VLLAVLTILAGLGTLGWWTQWLLMSAFWWGAYLRRHQLISTHGGADARAVERSPRSLARRVRSTLETPRSGLAVARSAGRRADARIERLGAAGARVAGAGSAGRARLEAWREGRGSLSAPSSARSHIASVSAVNRQGRRMSEIELRDARARARSAPAARAGIDRRRAQLERVQRERGLAIAGGNRRRAIELQHRAARIGDRIGAEEFALSAAQRTVAEERQPIRRVARAGARERARFLDRQASLPGAGAVAPSSGQGRDYPALAPIAGYGRDEYRRLSPARQRAARVEIDRQLAWRSEARMGAERGRAVRARPRPDATEPGAGRPRPATRGAGRHGRDRTPASGAPERAGSPFPSRQGESPVMRDAREVAAGRKRQLGSGRS
jgi:hypothetical protein